MADPTSWDRIVVGTDGSENANDAIRWATEEAAVHGATVEVLLAWSYIDQHHPDRSDTFDPGYDDDAARATLAAWVEEAIGPGADVEQRVVCDTPIGALATRATRPTWSSAARAARAASTACSSGRSATG